MLDANTDAHADARAIVPALLEEYGGLARAALFRYLPTHEPRRHLYDLAADYPRRGGRAMRPSLCIAATRAFGGSLEDALDTATAIELFHNALLIHDDIEDESEVRRRAPTLHTAHGVPLAINAGDTLALLSFRPLVANVARLGPYLSMRIIAETERMATESAEGQAMELGWRRDNTAAVSEADYLEMVLKKTCWLATIHPLRVGAMIATRDRAPLEPLIRFGFLLGAAFQIQDDMLNLVGDEYAYGKELDGDIHEGKRTLMLIRLLDRASAPERAAILELLARPRPERDAAQIRWVRALMDEYECIEYARRVAHGLAGAALHEFAQIFGPLPDSRDKQFIEGLITWVLARN
jgi:geranylgeranyl diphosphate synthase type II